MSGRYLPGTRGRGSPLGGTGEGENVCAADSAAHTTATAKGGGYRSPRAGLLKKAEKHGGVGRERASIGARPDRWTRDLDGRGDSRKPTHVLRSQQRNHGDVTAFAPHVLTGKGYVGRERASEGARPVRWTRDLDGRGDSRKPTHVQRSQQRNHGDVTAVAPHVLTGKHYVSNISANNLYYDLNSLCTEYGL